MALVAVNAGNTALASDLNQFRDLLTGVMTDQPVTLADGLLLNSPGSNLNTLRVIGNAGNGFYQAVIDSSAPAAGSSFGMQIKAGGNSSDYGLRIQDRTGADMFAVRGDHQTLLFQKYIFYGHNTAGTTIAAAPSTTTVPWTADYDPNSNFSGSTYTVPRSGRYLFTAQIKSSATASLNSFQVYIYKNGTTILATANALGSSSQSPSCCTTCMATVALGDTITVVSYGQGASFTLDNVAGGNTFAAYYLSD